MMWTVVVLLAALACVQAQTTITPELIEANEGDDATFNCSEIIVQSQFTVEIQRPGDTGFSTIPISDPRLSMEEVGTTAVYTYGPVERDEDGSLLRCNLGGVPSISATLRVYYLPEYVNPGMQSIVEGNDFVLDLNLTANPIPGDYQWQKDGVDITSGGRFTLTVDQIVIGTTQRNDAGGYTLTAMNIVGQATTSFELDVLFAPEPAPLGGTLAAQCDSESPMTCNLTTTNSGTLVCMAAGNPTPTIEVTSNALNQSNIGFSGATIQITNAVPENTGLYTCNFTNSVDSVTQDFQLNVGVVPDLVNVTAVESADRNNVVVSWVLIEPSVHVLVITYRITFTSNSANTFEVEETNTEVTIALSDLEEDTLYTVTVAGTNALGTSEPITTTYQQSEVLQFQLVLSGVQDCAQWVQQDVPDKLGDVTTSMQESVEQLCTCGFTPDDITDSTFECSKINADIVSFRATLHAVNTLEYIEQWREEGPAINVQGLILRVSADSNCPVVINSITDPLCEPTQTSTSSSEDDNTVGIVGGVIAGVVVLVCVTVVIIIAIIVAHRRVHHGAKSSSV